MANYRRTATGNWSTLAQWQDDSSGSYVNSTVLPGASDVVYANNFTVTLDQDVTVLELRTTTATNINAGGLFDYGAGCTTVTADIIAGTTTCLRHNLTTVKNLVGNIKGGTATLAFGVLNNSSGIFNITGNAIAGSGSESNGIVNNSGGTINVIGNVTGGSGSFAYGMSNRSSGSCNLTGNATGGTSPDAIGLNNNPGVTNIIGSAIGAAGLGASNGGSGQLYVNTAIASATNAGLNGNTSAGTTIVQSAINHSTGRLALSNFVRFSNAGPNTFTVIRQNNTTQTLVDASIGNPPVTDVRFGVIYASGALTGSAHIPSPANTALGVPVDNTVGTAIFTFQDWLNALASSPDPLAERLRNVSTVDSTAATIAAFKV